MKYFTNEVGSSSLFEWNKRNFFDLLFSFCSSYDEYYSCLEELISSSSHSVVLDGCVFWVYYE